ncbi:hypothetical protein CEXT_653471 [Caerostris extrusa]|uniref:Uncharacterized protein n=1 Tax=Caerostris extrusa TaxID=172846 RepID=A0AAV4WKK5_CAEEX|nr:hypothetical protein CEXT_653471 [Caerostris extrusa]
MLVHYFPDVPGLSLPLPIFPPPPQSGIRLSSDDMTFFFVPEIKSEILSWSGKWARRGKNALLQFFSLTWDIILCGWWRSTKVCQSRCNNQEDAS